MPKYAIRLPQSVVRPSTPGIIVGAVLLAAAATPLAPRPSTRLMPSPQTVHIGHFDATIKPVLTVESGDTVVIVASRPLGSRRGRTSPAVVPPSAVPEYTARPLIAK